MEEQSTVLQPAGGVRPETPSRLLPLVYGELRTAADRLLAQESPGHSLQATALVHEAYLRVTKPGCDPQWSGPAHFSAVLVEVMRRILVESARRKKRLKRGGSMTRQELTPDEIADSHEVETILALNEALDELAVVNMGWAELVKMRYFFGMTIQEAAATLGVAPRTADSWWASARLWLQKKLALDIGDPTP